MRSALFRNSLILFVLMVVMAVVSLWVTVAGAAVPEDDAGFLDTHSETVEPADPPPTSGPSPTPIPTTLSLEPTVVSLPADEPLLDDAPLPPMALVFDSGERIELTSDLQSSMPSELPPDIPEPQIQEQRRPSFAPAGLQPREHVEDTTVNPYRWVVNLEVTWPNTDFGICSGWLFEDSVIATAGHCVYDEGRGGWADLILATPGRNSKPSPFPYPQCTVIDKITNNIWMGDEGFPAQRPLHDWGIVIVDCAYVDLGHFGATTRKLEVTDVITVTGYPCDIPFNEQGEQYTNTGTVLGLESFLGGRDRIVSFDANVAGCNSGSPVYNEFMVYATVTQGYSDHGKGVLITSEILSALRVAVRVSNTIYLPLIGG